MVKNKKGQMGNLQGIMITLVVVGILVGSLFLVLDSLKDNFTYSTVTVVNESVIPTDAGVYLSYNSTRESSCVKDITIVRVVNESGTLIITAPNYTVNSITGLFKNVSGAAGYNGQWNVTYTLSLGSDSCGAVQDTITSSKQIPTFLPILIIVALVAIILAIVFKVLPGAGGGRETAYV